MHFTVPRPQLILGSWVVGTLNGQDLIFNQLQTNKPSLHLLADGSFYRNHRNPGMAGGGYVHTGETAAVRRIGAWLIGPKDSTHFVINKVGSSTPQLLIRSDGSIFCANGPKNGMVSSYKKEH